MPVDERVVSPDEYIVCRGVPVPIKYIREKEREFGAQMIEDPNLQEKLDAYLFQFRVQAMALKKKLNPTNNMVRARVGDMAGTFFFCDYVLPLGIYLPGLPMMEAKNHPHPIWFFKPKPITFGGAPL